MNWRRLSFSLIWILIFILCILIGYFTIKYPKRENVKITDTTYNTIVLDSIKYNIIVKDSIIIKIKHKYETEIIKVDNMSDSASVKLFKELCTSDSLYGGVNTIR